MPMAALRADDPHPRAAPRACRRHTLPNPHRDPGGLPHMSGHTSGFKRLPLLVLSLALATTPARAQVAGKVWEGSAGLGYVHYDSRDHLRDSGMLTASLGYRWSPALTFEGAWLGALTKRDANYPAGDVDHKWSWMGVDLRWNLRDPSERVTPYLLTGFGYGRSHDPDISQISQMGAPAAGLGL